jgi:DNA-binding NtrC family response regulator
MRGEAQIGADAASSERQAFRSKPAADPLEPQRLLLDVLRSSASHHDLGGLLEELTDVLQRVARFDRLVRYFVQKFTRRMSKRIESVPSEVMAALRDYDWLGNVRELANAIERAVILTSGPVLQVPIADFRRRRIAASESGTLEAVERETILNALRESKWVVGGPAGAATRLGLKRTTLQSRMEKLGIWRPTD